ncbi:2-isopropylmalate synthase [Natranaerovirga hydrolytica]|uniref:Citramalate synthase n=1 Tax=Natranaerovirga hydrolytica TaxID=680378 RepID=A0A4R1MZ41_9FIRM|nr:citramalate synthase [Natranaerovirga hydrolytica]TCK98435.1 2-isopropylmalate synthase [Natranaerovirga hydrolytica]
MSRVEIFDSTLRDGAQAEGISFSVEDKLKVVKAMDEMGIEYIEAGNPGSNPKDLEFFKEVKQIQLNHSKLTAFGSTRRRNIKVTDDANVQSLLEADTQGVAIFGKSWDFHVTDIIQTTLDENLNMIKETVAFFKEKGKEVFFDAEHFFDGFKSNKEYALASLKAAKEGGADCLVLCDTNGGTMPLEVYEMTKEVAKVLPEIKVGIHAHNDSGMAVANSIMAVEAGARHVQGTYIGFGERCGNANLSTIIANLQLKKGYDCIPEEYMEHLTSTAMLIAEIANITLSEKEPFVGRSAFTHKGGMHIDGVNKASHSFEHINPEIVGNARRFLMSEVAGRSTIMKKIHKIAPEITKESDEAKQIVDRLKELEHEGYQFEGAESTFELIIRKQLGKYKSFFELENFKIIGEQPAKDSIFSSYAMVKVNVDGTEELTAAEGDGPVHALDSALRKALEVFYPSLQEVHLTDYKVRVLDSKSATAAKVRVLITSSDGKDIWSTVGVSSDIIEASLIALIDSIEVKLLRDLENKIKAYI